MRAGRQRDGFRRWRPGLLLGAAVLGAVLACAALLPRGSGSTLRVEPSAGRATPGGSGPVTRPPAGVALPGHLPPATRPTRPTVLRLTRARSAVFDVRTLHGRVVKIERAEDAGPGEPDADATPAPGGTQTDTGSAPAAPLAPAPGPDSSFDGLDYATWGAGHPPDENGDVGPAYYIQVVNTSIGIFDKSTGTRVAAFTFNAFMSQGHFGNLCDTNNFGDPVVLYDSFEDRWFVSDFAFQLDGSGNVNPQTVYQCFAVSKSGDPVTGGWNFYSILAPGGLDDYPKFGVWPDGIYMSANMFGYGAGSGYISPHVWALDKQEMYADAPSVQVVDFAGPSADFTLLPANARLQTGTPPPGTPEYFVSTEEFLNAQTVYKLHVDWSKVSTSTFTGPDQAAASNCWPNSSVANAATPANALDTLQIRAMAQAQYTDIGGAESLWVDHTVNRGTFTLATCGGTNSNNATVRWYQLNVTGGSVAANDVQAATYDPDGTNTFFRFMPALAVDRAGDMAMVYSKSNATTNPQIKYAGRLAGDASNTLGQGEQTLINGTGSQSGTCGTSTCSRWGDYSGMALDPNGCEFWMTEEYYATTGLNDLTRIGSFHYPSCTPVGSGSLSGTVTDGTSPLAGATVALGSRTATTDSSGDYSFASLPAGTYPTLTVSDPGYDGASASTIAVPDGGSATRNFTLSAAAQSGCFADNSQSAFQSGIPNGCDLVASPGNVVLASPDNTDATNGSTNPTGFGFSNTTWAGQTFTPTVTGQLKRVDVELFCASCTATSPNVTLSIRSTTGSPAVPTGSDLATATLAGFNDGGAGGLKTFTFGSPITLTAGTRYAFVFRLASAFSSGTVAYTCSCAGSGYSDFNPYASGQRVTSTSSGSSWTADTTAGGRDLHFVTYINPGYASSGTFVSSLKDANPSAGHAAHWTTLSFTATTPAGTAVKFQVAASNSPYGPFDFVGPDGTAGTFFTSSGASLGQFDGMRYLRYEAFLSTGSPTTTPSLSSVSVCFSNVTTGPVALKVTAPARVTVGKFFLVHASAVDSKGDVVTSYSDPSAAVADSAGQVASGTTMAIASGVGQAKLKLTQPLKTETFTVTSGSLTGTSANVVALGPLATITVTRIGPFEVGSPYTVKATAYDSAGNVLTTYAGSATVSDLAGGSASTTFANGRLTTTLTPTSPSTADVVTVDSGGVTGTSTSFRVIGPLAQVRVTAVGPFVHGTPYTVHAWAEDAAGNVLTGYNGAATISDLDGGATTGSFSAGKLTVQLTPTAARTGNRVTVTTGAVSGTSNPFRVT